MFTDKSSFSVLPKQNRLQAWRVRRKSRQRIRLKHIVFVFKSRYRTASVWIGFSLPRRTPLVETVGGSAKYKYRSIIDNRVLPFGHDIDDWLASFVLQEDNCGPHRAKCIADYLANEEVIRMKWPPQSPDLNSIENVWGSMKAYRRNHKVHLKNPFQLFRIPSNIWNTLLDSYFQNLVAWIPKRIKMVRNNRGEPTKY